MAEKKNADKKKVDINITLEGSIPARPVNQIKIPKRTEKKPLTKKK